MYQPSKSNVKEYTSTLMEFGGLNRRARGNENEFSDMVNMSSKEYPLLSPRKRRAVAYSTDNNITTLHNKEALLWNEYDGIYNRFFVNANEVEDFKSTVQAERQIVGMGAYAVLFPDNKYINLLDSTDKGDLGNKFQMELTSSSDFQIIPCTIEGVSIEGVVDNTAPENPANSDVWVDTSGEKSVYKKWDSATSQWVQISTVYFLLSSSNIATGFSKWDAVRISGLSVQGASDRVTKQVDALNAEGAIIYNVCDKGLVFAGIVDEVCGVTSGKVTIERKIPDMDFVVECNNRLWGCKYGMVDGKVVNEIYACRQGDFKNWYAYLGISTDSYAVTVGSEGAFTGAAIYNKNPVFFKENCIHQLYGSAPSSFQMVTTTCEGVEKGQGSSICSTDNVLYYKGPTGFFAYAGSLPQKISRPLGEISFEKVIGGGVGDKVYFACGEAENEKTIYVYDTYNHLWHKEDERNILCFSRDGHILYMLIRENGLSHIESLTDETDILIQENSDLFPQIEKTVNWSAESVDIGYGDVNMKYIDKITVRAKLTKDSWFRVLLSCDGEEFRKIGEKMYEEGVHTNSISFTPKRCEYFRYRLEGEGDVCIISVSKHIKQGSDKP